MGEFRLTMGQYDSVVEAEAPNDEVLASLLLAIASGGTVVTKTLRTFTEDERRQIVGLMP